MSVLLDSTPLSNFAAVDRLDLVREVVRTAYLADAVYRELREGIALGYTFLHRIDRHVVSSENEGWLEVVGLRDEREHEIHRSLPGRLHEGERVSLALAKSRGWQLFTDDRAARKFAVRLGVEVSGTLGILLELIGHDAIALDAANVLLADMIRLTGYRAPVTDLRRLAAR